MKINLVLFYNMVYTGISRNYTNIHIWSALIDMLYITEVDNHEHKTSLLFTRENQIK